MKDFKKNSKTMYGASDRNERKGKRREVKTMNRKGRRDSSRKKSKGMNMK